MKEVFEGTYGSISVFDFTTTLGETYFNISYYKSKYDENYGVNEEMEGITNEASNSSSGNIKFSIDELFLPFFALNMFLM